MQEPLTGPAVCVTVGVLQLSVAVASAQLTVQQVPATVGVFTIFPGQVITGGVTSVPHALKGLTVIVNEQVAELPLASTAL